MRIRYLPTVLDVSTWLFLDCELEVLAGGRGVGLLDTPLFFLLHCFWICDIGRVHYYPQFLSVLSVGGGFDYPEIHTNMVSELKQATEKTKTE